LYELARRGEEITRAPRRVEIHVLELLEWAPPVATLFVDCSKGTYVRALARDLGDALGPGAHLSNLVRLRTGPFALCQAITLAELAEVPLPWAWPEIAVHPDAVLADWPALLLDDAAAAAWCSGGRIPAAAVDGSAPAGIAPDGPVRAYAPGGDWLGVGAADPAAGAWRPLKVVGDAA
jgi:tRNA pseudouridine55 synthase